MGPQGPAVVNYTANYASTTNYGLHDAVSYLGSTWVSLVAGNVGNTPDQSPSWWALLAAQGPAGPIGPQGPRGWRVRLVRWSYGTGWASGTSGEFSGDVAGGDVVCGWERDWVWRVELCGDCGERGAGAGFESDILGCDGAGGNGWSAGSYRAAGPGWCSGDVGVTYRGAWVIGTTYSANDVVVFNGASYLAAELRWARSRTCHRLSGRCWR